MKELPGTSSNSNAQLEVPFKTCPGTACRRAFLSAGVVGPPGLEPGLQV